MPAVALDNMSSENEITYDVSTEPMRRGRELSYVSPMMCICPLGHVQLAMCKTIKETNGGQGSPIDQ